MDFRWAEWNTQHIAAHGVEPGEAEEVIENARTVFVIHARDLTTNEKRRMRRR